MNMLYKYCCIFLAFILVFGVSCDKVTLECDYYIYTKTQETEESQIVPSADVMGFAFYTNTLTHRFESYEEAVSGRISSIVEGGQQKAYDVQAIYDAEDNKLVFESLTQKSVVLVVCDTRNSIYSYRQIDLVKGIGELVITLTTYPWRFIEKPDAVIKVNQWYQQK